MATKQSNAASNAAAAAQAAHLQSTEQTCQQMAAATEAAAHLCRSVEAMQLIQQQAVQRWALRLQQAADQMRGSSTSADLWGIHMSLMGSGVQEMTHTMQELALATSRVQGALFSRASAQPQPAATPASTASDATRAAVDAANAATTAMLNSWSSMMGGASGASSGRSAQH